MESSRGYNDEEEAHEFRDIHALTPASRRSSIASEVMSENFSSMSREFNALVLAGSNIEQEPNLDRIGEDEAEAEEGADDDSINPLAIVPDVNPLPLPLPLPHPRPSPRPRPRPPPPPPHSYSYSNNDTSDPPGVEVHRVKKEEVDAKITAWETAKIAKINNRFKRQDAIITGWENEQVHTASTRMKFVERKLEEKRARAREKMENEIAKAHRKAEERRATAEGKRGRKVAKVVQVASLMRAVGRPPAKRSFF
ncbi:hypothetical protein vseg_007660 [Gypsophila vaccaria]